MLKKNKELAPERINGNIAILCSSESLNSAESLISKFSDLSNISLYIEKSNKVSICNGKPSILHLENDAVLQLECTLKQCFSPLDYSCTVCIGNNSSFLSIAENCNKCATPVYILDNYAS